VLFRLGREVQNGLYLICAAVAAVLEHARQEWQAGYRRLQAAAGDAALYRRLLRQVEAVTDELRRRVGQTFTLAELADAYEGVDAWGWEVLAQVSGPADLGHATTVKDAAFHLYSRGAVDYAP
jgi:hypothetical protein